MNESIGDTVYQWDRKKVPVHLWGLVQWLFHVPCSFQENWIFCPRFPVDWEITTYALPIIVEERKRRIHTHTQLFLTILSPNDIGPFWTFLIIQSKSNLAWPNLLRSGKDNLTRCLVSFRKYLVISNNDCLVGTIITVWLLSLFLLNSRMSYPQWNTFISNLIWIQFPGGS